MTLKGGGRDHHDSGNFARIIDCIHERERGAPRMTDQNWALDADLCERVMKQLRLNFDGGLAVLWSLAPAVTGTIESDDFMTRRQRRELCHPILRGTGVTVNKNDGAAGALNYVVQTRAIYGYEF